MPNDSPNYIAERNRAPDQSTSLNSASLPLRAMPSECERVLGESAKDLLLKESLVSPKALKALHEVAPGKIGGLPSGSRKTELGSYYAETILSRTSATSIDKLLNELSNDIKQNPNIFQPWQRELVEVAIQARELGIKRPFRFISLTASSDGTSLNLDSTKNILAGMKNPDFNKPLVLCLYGMGGADVFIKQRGNVLPELSSTNSFRIYYADISTIAELKEHLNKASLAGKYKSSFTILGMHGCPYGGQLGNFEENLEQVPEISRSRKGNPNYLTCAEAGLLKNAHDSKSTIFLASCLNAAETSNGEPNFAQSVQTATESRIVAYGNSNNACLKYYASMPAIQRNSLMEDNNVALFPLGSQGGSIYIQQLFDVDQNGKPSPLRKLGF